jgi:hypothetical protein
MLCKSPVDLVQLSDDCRQNLSRGVDDPAEIWCEDSRDRFWSKFALYDFRTHDRLVFRSRSSKVE